MRPRRLAVSSPEKNWEVWGRKKGKQKIKVAVEEQLTDPALNLDDEHDDEEVVAKRAKPKAGEDALLGYAWPGVIDKHIEHWATRPDAREYANDDIVYTRALDKHFGYPTPGDNDSTLACMVPVVRWHGFSINKAGMAELLAKAQAVVASSPVNINKPGEVRAYITAAMDPTETIVLEESTKKSNLEAILNWEIAAARAVRPVRGHARLRPLRRHGLPPAGQASGGRPVQANPGREDRRQGSGTVQEAAAGRQVPRQLRGDRHPLQPHGRGGWPEPARHQARQRRAQDVPALLGAA